MKDFHSASATHKCGMFVSVSVPRLPPELVDGKMVPEKLSFTQKRLHDVWSRRCPKCHGVFGFRNAEVTP